MKKTVMAAMVLIMMLLLSGCGCNHTWVEANCTTAKTCTLCNTTEGNPLDHNWMEATCDTPKTCVACALSEGEAQGHNWQDATCITPKTCTTCNSIEGNVLGHTYEEWFCTGEQFEYSCIVCGEKQTLTPEEFFLELLEGEWSAIRFPNDDLGESVTFRKDGTADINLASNLFHPDTVRMIAGELFYAQSSKNWGINYYLEDHLTEDHNKLDPDHGLYLLVTVRENQQENGTVVILQHKGYRYSWTLTK